MTMTSFFKSIVQSVAVVSLILLVSSSCEDEKSQIPTDGLVAYYPFNGNSKDLSGNDLHGVTHDATLTNDRHGKTNSAYSFDGDDYVAVEHNELLNFGNDDNFSISLWAWIDPDQVSGTINDIIRKWSGDAQGYPFTVSYNNDNAASLQRTVLGARYNNAVCYEIPMAISGVVEMEQFHHIVLTKDGSNLTLYIDNEQVSVTTDVTECSTQNNSHMTIGCRGQLSNFFVGKIDDIRIYNRTLTSAEIAALFEE